MACQVLLFVKSQIHQDNKNFYSQSLGNLEVIGVQKTACVADMTSRSYNPEFNNPLEKVVNTFQRYNTVAVSMHKIGHFTPNILAYSRIPAAYSTLLFTGCVCGIFQGKMLVLQLVIPENIHIPVPTDRENFHPPGRGRGKLNVLRCLGGGMWKQICARGNTL